MQTFPWLKESRPDIEATHPFEESPRYKKGLGKTAQPFSMHGKYACSSPFAESLTKIFSRFFLRILMLFQDVMVGSNDFPVGRRIR
ncbi:hypothetical protein SAMN05216404_105161 [Nitrosospira multiformis]|uniref:Uncharacterized protein n=1 Tax=Nitrosospira multiformis TaxID=1231 RepID=A0A1H8HL32_9PROT|nr:hypothetical protein SAMN05216404_105161 [Nitrosospira multiformis]